jgi:hypothetical protein
MNIGKETKKAKLKIVWLLFALVLIEGCYTTKYYSLPPGLQQHQVAKVILANGVCAYTIDEAYFPTDSWLLGPTHMICGNFGGFVYVLPGIHRISLGYSEGAGRQEKHSLSSTKLTFTAEAGRSYIIRPKVGTYAWRPYIEEYK